VPFREAWTLLQCSGGNDSGVPFREAWTLLQCTLESLLSFRVRFVECMTQIREGTSVKWNWGNGTGEGKVTEVFKDRVTRTLNGSEIAKNGSDEEPAYLIEQDDGAQVLKLATEVERAD